MAKDTDHNFKYGPFLIFDDYGNETYYEDSTGYWEKREFDDDNNKIYYEDSTGFWVKRKFDINNNETYYEDSNEYG